MPTAVLPMLMPGKHVAVHSCDKPRDAYGEVMGDGDHIVTFGVQTGVCRDVSHCDADGRVAGKRHAFVGAGLPTIGWWV